MSDNDKKTQQKLKDKRIAIVVMIVAYVILLCFSTIFLQQASV